MSGLEWIPLAVAGAQAAIAGVTLLAGRAQAKAQSNIAKAQAQALESQAGEERSAAQRAAMVQRQQGRLVSSRATALAAASGAGALDPSIVNILADIGEESEYRALTALYQGESQGRNLEYSARLARATGSAQAQATRTNSYLSAGNTLLSAGSGLYDRYATSRPPTASAASPSGFITRSVPLYSYG